MDVAHADTAPSQTTKDFNTVKQTINDYMDGKLNASDARNKFQAEVTMLNNDKDSDAVLKMFTSSKDLPSLFPNLSVDNHDDLTVKPAGGTSRDSVLFSSFENNAGINITSELELKTGEQAVAAQEAKENAIADKALTVANDFFHGKLSMSETKKQIDGFVQQGLDSSDPSNGPYSAFESALSRESAKFPISLDLSAGSYDYGIYAPTTSLWGSIEIKDGKATVESATSKRIKDDAIWAAGGAAIGASVGGPIGAAVGGAFGIAEGELHRYQNGEALKIGTKNIFDEQWMRTIEDMLPE